MNRTNEKLFVNHYASRLSTLARVVAIAVGVAVVVGLAAPPARAQTVPQITFGASVTEANGQLSTRLTWSTTPAASSCAASGHQSWTGTKPATGSFDLAPITMSGSYTVTLGCSWAGDTDADLTWTAPTTNTDGTALAKCASATSTGGCLALFNVYHATTAAGVANGEMTPVRNPNATTFKWTGLAPGPHYFAIEAVNGNGAASGIGAVTPVLTLAAATTKSANVTLTVNPVPGKPTNADAK